MWRMEKEVLNGSYYVIFLLFHGVNRTVPERICCGSQEMRWRSRKSGLVFRRSICCAVSDPDRAVWRRGTGSDEISGGHDDVAACR